MLMRMGLKRSQLGLAAILTLVALMTFVSVAEARGGRTTAADCAAGSDDPDCPDKK